PESAGRRLAQRRRAGALRRRPARRAGAGGAGARRAVDRRRLRGAARRPSRGGDGGRGGDPARLRQRGGDRPHRLGTAAGGCRRARGSAERARPASRAGGRGVSIDLRGGGRVLLVNPRMCSERAMRLPISLLSLGAVLEGKVDYELIDGNVDGDAVGTTLAALAASPTALVGVSVMPGPQVAPAIELSAAVRAAHPQVPIAWGGYFPTMYPESAINAPYVDYVVRGQGEDA